MAHINISDINKRLISLKSISNSSDEALLESGSQYAIESKNPHVIKRYIEMYVKSNLNISFPIYLELFDAIIKYGSKSDISNAGDYITENVIPKVRDSKLTNSLIKGRLTRLRHKLNPTIDVDAGLGNASPKTTTVDINISSDSTSDDKIEAATEAYNAMLDKSIIMIHCDRIAENYNRISMRFNLDRLFIENTRINGIEDTVVELCNMIDTYTMSSMVKFNTVIETAYYGFQSNFINYTPSQILETAVDYFLLFKPDGVAACKEILESTMLFDKDKDMKNIDIVHEEEPEEDKKNSISDNIMHTYSKTLMNKPIKEETDFNAIFNKFKQKELQKTDKPQNKLKSLINSLYRKDVNNIVDGTPDLLKWIRRFFILSSFSIPAIGPVIGIVGFIADKFISIHVDRDQYLLMIKAFNNEIKQSKDKLKSSEDSEQKAKLEKYIKSLENARDTISNEYNKLLTDEEQDKRFENMDAEGYTFDSDDFDFDDEFDLNENSVFNRISNSINNLVCINDTYNCIDEDAMYHIIQKLPDQDMENVSKITGLFPEVFFKESVNAGLSDYLRDIKAKKIEYKSILEKSMRISAIEKSISIVNTESPRKCETIFEAADNLDTLVESVRALSIMIDAYNNHNHLLEASFTNTLNLASMKLRNAIQKLSDKDRQISKSMDVGVNNLKKGIERALTNDNREAIIKGSVLPSFSKLVKLGIMNAGLIAIGQPLIAIITTIGYFAVNGKFKAKERQMIIDELEIELEICEKYINIAEQKNDMKALRQLLTTKRELERQRQRIKYKMKVDFGQKYYDAKAPD